VDGDFWHGCPIHFPARDPGGPNAELWSRKFEATRIRDQRATALAEAAGWRVVRLWECEIRDDPDTAARRVLSGTTPSPQTKLDRDSRLPGNVDRSV
jgi:DNA mismatch endonuclease (patch repair protein)